MNIRDAQYKGQPVWLAHDVNSRPVTFGGLIATNTQCDFKNAKSFIYSQIIELDSISKFAEIIGEDGQSANILKMIVENDRNMSFWVDLAKKWFNAEWQGDIDE